MDDRERSREECRSGAVSRPRPERRFVRGCRRRYAAFGTSGSDGDEKVQSLTIEILKQIRDQIATTNVRLEELRADMNTRFERLETLTARGFEAVSSRLDNMRDSAGERWRDHEERIRKLEQRSGT